MAHKSDKTNKQDDDSKIANEFKITEEKVGEYREAFNIFDKDGSGTITVEELRQVMVNMGQKCTIAEAKRMIAEVDTDNNQTIELREFIEMMLKKTANPKDELYEAFKTFDKDGNGKISHSELKLVMKNMGNNMDDSEIDQMILAADMDGDHEISFEEFKKMMTC